MASNDIIIKQVEQELLTSLVNYVSSANIAINTLCSGASTYGWNDEKARDFENAYKKIVKDAYDSAKIAEEYTSHFEKKLRNF